jgi:hypothetical protein
MVSQTPLLSEHEFACLMPKGGLLLHFVKRVRQQFEFDQSQRVACRLTASDRMAFDLRKTVSDQLDQLNDIKLFILIQLIWRPRRDSKYRS